MADSNVVGAKDQVVERSSSSRKEKEHDSKKGKGPAKKQTPPPSKSDENENASLQQLLGAITAIQEKLDKQNERLNKLEDYEQYEQYDDYGNEYDDTFSVEQSTSQSCSGEKRTLDSNNNDSTRSCSRFANLAKKFKTSEICDQDIDPTYAENITDLFRNGIDEDRYNDLIKDEINARPGNCEGLGVVKLNQLIWDSVTPSGRTTDKKMQNIETSVIKAATFLCKAVNDLAKLTSAGDSVESDKLNTIIDDCNNVMALLGHANKQINTTRKDFLKPELNKEYSHLCSHSRPFTQFFFGYDVSKSAKELEGCSKISNRMFHTRPRGMRVYRLGRFPRARGLFTSRSRGRGQAYGQHTHPISEPKNFPRRVGRIQRP